MSFLDQFQQITLRDFYGLYNRGSIDNTPPERSFTFQNLATRGKKKELTIRDGTAQSVNVGHNVVRIFQSNISTLTGTQGILTCDGAGHIYQDSGTLLLTVTGMIDFAAINLFNHTYILPIGPTTTSFMYVWDGVHAPRQAAGNAPTVAPVLSIGTPTGGPDLGVHSYRVCFVTDTGFTTPPGPSASINQTVAGGANIDVTNIQTGPTGTVQRVLIGTKANGTAYFFIPGNGVIHDNTTTTAIIDSPDSALVISADYLFNLKTQINSSTAGYGQASMVWYRGHLVILDGTTTNQLQVSDSGLVEQFNTVTGFVTVDAQQDQYSTGFEYFGTFYVYGQIGLHAIQDNGNVATTWASNLVDMSPSTAPASLTNTTIVKYPGPLGSIVLGITRQGLYAFNGSMLRPALSINIQNVFDTFTHGAEFASMLAVDVTRDVLYMLLPLNGSVTPNTLVVGDFSDGLSADTLQWSVYTFPFTPQAICVAKWNDGGDNDYWLRIGTSSDIRKLSSQFTDDSGTPIQAVLQTSLFDYGEGSIDQFRFLRVRAKGSGNISIALSDQDGANVVNPPGFTLPSPSKDLQRHINYLAEKMSVTLSMNGGSLTLNRVEMWGKQRYQMLPD